MRVKYGVSQLKSKQFVHVFSEEIRRIKRTLKAAMTFTASWRTVRALVDQPRKNHKDKQFKCAVFHSKGSVSWKILEMMFQVFNKLMPVYSQIHF